MLGFSLLQQLQYCVVSEYLSPNVPRKICHLVAITIGISKMAEGDKYLDYPDKTLERMAKLLSTFVRALHYEMAAFALTV